MMEDFVGDFARGFIFAVAVSLPLWMAVLIALRCWLWP